MGRRICLFLCVSSAAAPPSGVEHITVREMVCNLLEKNLRQSLRHRPWRFVSHSIASIAACSLPVNLRPSSP